MKIRLFSDTKILAADQPQPVLLAAADLARDLKKTCRLSAEEKSGQMEEKRDQQEERQKLLEKERNQRQEGQEAEICWAIRLQKGEQEKECYRIFVEGDELIVEASEDFGFIYGLYAISREILGIHNFWFWNDQAIVAEDFKEVDRAYTVQSKPFAVRLRGWFINDEVLLHTWKVERRKEGPWEMALEALLRCGGNMVIPGTDKNSRINRKLVFKRGLYLTHHHAEPLGAEMFARAYPGIVPSYDQNSEKYQKLWREAIEEQKGQKVVWNIGFRGQGDVPFWENDPAYDTPKARGELISQLIRLQYAMVKEADPDALCCTNLYGEIMELYQDGWLNLPEDLIYIWADNGFGKMVTRRQENHNPRIPAMPEEGAGGRHGIYYHVSFYDLQAANHITMLPNPPTLIKRELDEVQKRGMGDYWLINCSNIKPHVYYLDFLSVLWREGDADIDRHMDDYIAAYYGKAHKEEIKGCFREYFAAALFYGPNEDDRAGEQFANHVCRMLISQYMRDKDRAAENLLWATKADTLRGQIAWYQEKCRCGKAGSQGLLRKCEQTKVVLSGAEKELFEDSVLLQAKIYDYCYTGACLVTEGLLAALEEDYQKAFYLAGKGRKAYLAANQAMRSREHGKWNGFYENECLTDIKQTAWVIEGLMSYLRNLGDGPHYYQWQRDFLYAEEDRRVMLVMTMENHLRDEELFALMEEKWGK